MRPAPWILAALTACGTLVLLPAEPALAADEFVPTEVSIRWVADKEKFKGTVVSTELGYEDPGCVDKRHVVVKRKQEGQDKVVNRDLTNENGNYQVRNFLLKDKYHTGRFYARAVPVEIESPEGQIFKCRAARSEIIRAE